VVEFVPDDQVDPIMFERSYFLEPDSKSAKAYVLLRQTLEATNRTAIVKFALRQKTRLGALRVRDGVLVLQGLLWADEVRKPEFQSLSENVKVTDKELDMSARLVASYESDFSPEKFEDDYQIQLKKLIDAKLEQGESIDTGATFGEEGEGEKGEVLDLMEALRRSVEKNRGAKKGTSTGSKSRSSKPRTTKPRAPKADTGSTGTRTRKKAG
jgi:DNA end-binding protein Ku